MLLPGLTQLRKTTWTLVSYSFCMLIHLSGGAMTSDGEKETTFLRPPSLQPHCTVADFPRKLSFAVLVEFHPLNICHLCCIWASEGNMLTCNQLISHLICAQNEVNFQCFSFQLWLLALHFTHARQQSFQTNIASRLASLLSCNFSSVTMYFLQKAAG